MPRISSNSLTLRDGSTLLLPAAVRLFRRASGYALAYGSERRIRFVRVSSAPTRHQVARALLSIGAHAVNEVRGYATASRPPDAQAWGSS